MTENQLDAERRQRQKDFENRVYTLVDKLNDQMTTLIQSMAEVKGDVRGVKADIAANQVHATQIRTNELEITNLRNELRQARQEIATIKETMALTSTRSWDLIKLALPFVVKALVLGILALAAHRVFLTQAATGGGS